jgi:hypothetical protein
LPLITLTELRLGLRAGAFRAVAALLFLAGAGVGGAGGNGVGMSAYATGEFACQFLGIAAALWVAQGAIRDTSLRTGVLVFTKPQPPERLTLARFLGLYGQILCFLVALFAGAMVGRLYVAGNLNGFPAYGLQYLRAAGTLFFAASASYCLALLTDSMIAGSLIGLYWVVAMAGKAFLGKFYFPWYSQNLPAYMLFGLALLGLAAGFSRRRMRGEAQAALWARLTPPLALLGGFALLWNVVRNGHDPMAFESQAMVRMSVQDVVLGELTPGFLLPDQDGKPTSLSQFPDRILLIALWSPHDPDSTQLLAHLDAVYHRYGARGVLPVAICLSEDTGAAATFAVGERIRFPMVYDWGTYHASRQEETSPLALAYRAGHLPRLVMTDRRHRVRMILDDLDAYEGFQLDGALNQRLTEEPE